MSDNELMVLRMLIDNPKGLFGSDFVDLSEGRLRRGSIYTTLARMSAKGYVTEAHEPPEAAHLTSRTRYKISAAGHKTYQKFLSAHGLVTVGGSFARAKA